MKKTPTGLSVVSDIAAEYAVKELSTSVFQLRLSTGVQSDDLEAVQTILAKIPDLDRSKRAALFSDAIAVLKSDMEKEQDHDIKNDVAIFAAIFNAAGDAAPDLIKEHDFSLCQSATIYERPDLFRIFAEQLNQAERDQMVESTLTQAIDYCQPIFEYMCEIVQLGAMSDKMDERTKNYVFFAAAHRGNLALVNFFLSDLTPEKQIALVKSENSTGECAPFRYAANSGKVDVAARLLEVASEQSDRNDIIAAERHYALQYALCNDHAGIVDLIMDKASPAIFEEMFDPTNANYSPERDKIAAEIKKSVKAKLAITPENEAVRRFISSPRVAGNPQILNNLFDSETLALIQSKDTSTERTNSASRPTSASKLSPRTNQNEHN